MKSRLVKTYVPTSYIKSVKHRQLYVNGTYFRRLLSCILHSPVLLYKSGVQGCIHYMNNVFMMYFPGTSR